MPESGEGDDDATVSRRTGELLRDARSMQRRLDTLMSKAMAVDDPCLDRVVEARSAVERLVLELSYRHRGEQRRGRPGGRRPG